jgi:hypothetical protein
VLYLSWNWTKVWIYYLAYTNIANKNCVKFCMKEVFKCRERRMMRWDVVWTKAQAWGCPCHPKKYLRSTSVKAWGYPEAPLLHQQKYQVIFQDTIFLLLRMLCVFLGASLFFSFSYFFLFALINGWTPTYFFWRIHTLFFIAKNTLVFILIVQWVFSFFNTAFSYHFSPWFFFRTC